MEELFFPVTRREAERQGIQYSSEKNRNARFPSLLRELRDGMGQSQAELSKKLGVSKSTVGLWETGDTLPDAKAIRDIADYFDVNTDYLLGRTKLKTADMDLKKACEYFGLSEELGEAIQSYYSSHIADHYSVRMKLSWIFEKIVICPSFLFALWDVCHLLSFYSDISENITKEHPEGNEYQVSGTTITDKDILEARIHSAEANFRQAISHQMDRARRGEYSQLKELISSIENADKADK